MALSRELASLILRSLPPSGCRCRAEDGCHTRPSTPLGEHQETLTLGCVRCSLHLVSISATRLIRNVVEAAHCLSHPHPHPLYPTPHVRDHTLISHPTIPSTLPPPPRAPRIPAPVMGKKLNLTKEEMLVRRRDQVRRNMAALRSRRRATAAAEHSAAAEAPSSEDEVAARVAAAVAAATALCGGPPAAGPSTVDRRRRRDADDSPRGDTPTDGAACDVRQDARVPHCAAEPRPKGAQDDK